MPVQFTLNQKPVAHDAPPEKPLLWALREDTPLTGTLCARPLTMTYSNSSPL